MGEGSPEKGLLLLTDILDNLSGNCTYCVFSIKLL